MEDREKDGVIGDMRTVKYQQEQEAGKFWGHTKGEEWEEEEREEEMEEG